MAASMRRGSSRRRAGSARRGARRVATRARATRDATSATSTAFSTRWGSGSPLDRHQNIGNSSVRHPRTGTPRSRGPRACAARSRNAFAPELTVTTGCAAIAPRSALTSPVRSTPRCTPPMPPVANTSDPYGRGERERCGDGRDADRRAARDRDGELALGNFHASVQDALVFGDFESDARRDRRAPR